MNLGVDGKERLNLAALEYYLLSERERLPFNAFVTGVQHLPGGWFLRLGPGENQPIWPRTSRELTTYESFLRAWRTAVSLMATEATAVDNEILLGFSGGLDSRFILGLLTELGIPTRLLHMPTGNQRQTEIAVATARRLGQRLEVVLPPLRELSHARPDGRNSQSSQLGAWRRDGPVIHDSQPFRGKVSERE